jgi:protein-S-isoprenylcysteine O-methyltransferase Ste14
MVEATAHKYRCNLERFGTPPWACRILILVLALFVAAGSFGVAFFTMPNPDVPRWVPLLACVAGSVAIALLFRAWRTTADPASR